MKISMTIMLLSFLLSAFAQKREASFPSIDFYVAGVESNSVEDLAHKLTKNYSTELEKTRAIFSWIAQHIDYNYRSQRNASSRKNSNQFTIVNEVDDTSTVLKPLNLIVAETVLKRKIALCDGYARLFKCLCDFAGVRSEIVNGYARAEYYRTGRNFRTNHSWNVVMIDSTWHLLDVTWASGYISYGSNDFVKRFDDKYFLTPPEEFAKDHFPDDLSWALLQQPSLMKEFQGSPFKTRCFIKYNISSYSPSTGVIQAALGDTINLELHIDDLARSKKIGSGGLDDIIPQSASVFCKPLRENTSGIINYSYIVNSASTEWLHLVYNDDMVLRYKLNITDKKKVY